jgi:molybdate transport system substrate-binding protein
MVALVFLWVLGCQRSGVDPTEPAGGPRRNTRAESTSSAPLRIAAASDLQVALPRLGERFQAQTGLAVSCVFGSSGRLAEQIKQGAPFDLYLAANQAFVRELANAKFIRPDSVHPYARGSLVLAVYRELGQTVAVLDDLLKPEVKKIALANPGTAPYGKAGKQALERAGLWDRLQPKIVQAESVAQALLYARTGDAEAALVGRAIADVPEVRSIEIDPALYDPIVQALGIVADTKRPADAAKFVQFLQGSDGEQILKEHGFLPVDERQVNRAEGRPAPAGGPAKKSVRP